MTSIIIGAVGAFVVIGAFLLGAAFGARFSEAKSCAPNLPAVSAEEKTRLLEDQRAFEDLLHYNADVVYGKTALGGDSL